jgi:hypothetical protein
VIGTVEAVGDDNPAQVELAAERPEVVGLGARPVGRDKESLVVIVAVLENANTLVELGVGVFASRALSGFDPVFEKERIGARL